MARLSWFPFEVDAWLLDEKVLAMSWAERGVYLHLLCLQWREAGISPAPARLMRALGITPADDVDLPGILRDCFPPHPSIPGRLANPKMLKVQEAQRLTSEKRGAAARKAGASRASAGQVPGGVEIEREVEVTTSLLSEFPDKAHRDAVATALAGQHPQAVEATIHALHDGTHRTYPFPVIGRALVELQAAGTTFSARALDAFCRHILAGDPPPRPRGTARQTQREKSLAVLDAAMAREDTP